MKTIFIIIFLLLRFDESYSQWIQQQSGTTITLHDIEFINGLTGWASGDGGLILKTSNGGINWINQPTEAIGKPLLGIHPVNENIVYATGWYNTILKTTNGGQNWISIRNGPVGQGRSFFSLFFINEQTGWVNGLSGLEGSMVLKTTDGGENWADIFSTGVMRDMFFKDSLNGIGVGEGTFISRTSNGGINWLFYTISPPGNFYRISFINDFTGFVISSNGYDVYKTMNFGESFDSVGYIPGIQERLYCSEFINDNIGWTVSNFGEIFKTENGGSNWKIQKVINSYISSIFALNDSVAWMCGAGGKILYTTNGGDTITSISQISTTIPEDFELTQNYPNPFNPSTTIEIKINETGSYLLEIFDINGKIIQNVLSSTFNPGTYRYVFYANGLSTGIYFYRLTNTDKIINNSTTKSMILLK